MTNADPQAPSSHSEPSDRPDPGPDGPLESFLARVARRTARVAVIGLGHAGLPLARAFCRAGFSVLGVDTHPAVVARLAAGGSHLAHVPAAAVRAMLERGFEPTSDPDRLAGADAALVCVPAPLAGAREPDPGPLRRAAAACARALRPGRLVALETVAYPGAAREVVKPALEESGLRAGRDFFLAVSPTRADPGDGKHPAESVPKVVGGLDPAGLRAAEALYAAAFERVVPVSSAEVAEACRLLEGTYRAVNVALANEMKVACEALGIDVWEVIDAAGTKPFGFRAFAPGPGVGGRSLPADPWLLAWAARRAGAPAHLAELAAETNAAMPARVVARVAEALGDRGKALKGSRVALAGVAYKAGSGDCRGSPALAVLDGLRARGAAVGYHDPLVPELPAGGPHRRGEDASRPLTAEFLEGQDCVVVMTDQPGIDWGFVVGHSALVVDARDATRSVARRGNVVRA